MTVPNLWALAICCSILVKNKVKVYIHSKNIAAKAAKSTEIAPDEMVADDE